MTRTSRVLTVAVPVALAVALPVVMAVARAGPGAPVGGPAGGTSGGSGVPSSHAGVLSWDTGAASSGAGTASSGAGAASSGAGDLAVRAGAARAGPTVALPRPVPGRAAAASAPGSPGVGAADALPRWRWPLLPRPPVLRTFRAPLTDYGRGHRGLDLAAEVSAPVLAVDGGVVTHAGVVAGRGTVTVRHAGGLSSTYEPVSPGVGVGSTVTVGDAVGTIAARAGPAHCGARACLHLGARSGDTYLDPLPLLVGGRVALLPLE